MAEPSAAPKPPDAPSPPPTAGAHRERGRAFGPASAFAALSKRAQGSATATFARASEGLRSLRLSERAAQHAHHLRTWQAAAVAAFAVGLLGVLLANTLVPTSPKPADEARERTAPRGDAAPTPGSATAERTEPTAGPEIRGVPEVIDTATLRLEGKVIRLFGVEWDRGGVGDELSSYLRGRLVTCKPAGQGDAYRCAVDGRDLSQAILYNGGGRAASSATPELIEAENHARSQKIGVWNK